MFFNIIDPVISALTKLFTIKDAIINVSKIIDFNIDPSELSLTKRSLNNFFDELQNTVETSGEMKNNIFAEIEFLKWLNDIDLDEVRSLASQAYLKYRPTGMLIEILVGIHKPNPDIKQRTCEFKVRTAVVCSPSGEKVILFPIQTKNIVMGVYKLEL